MDYYECEECYSRTLSKDAVHINYRMKFDNGFGTFSRVPYVHCCSCTTRLGGQTCDHEAGLWTSDWSGSWS